MHAQGVFPVRVTPAQLAARGVPIPPHSAARDVPSGVWGLAFDDEMWGTDAAAGAAFPAQVERGLEVLASAFGAREAKLETAAPPWYPAAPPGVLAIGAELLRHVAAAAEGTPMISRLVAVGGF